MQQVVPVAPRQLQASQAFACTLQQLRMEFPCSWKPPSWSELSLGAPDCLRGALHILATHVFFPLMHFACKGQCLCARVSGT